jgi:hypothetical protein
MKGQEDSVLAIILVFYTAVLLAFYVFSAEVISIRGSVIMSMKERMDTVDGAHAIMKCISAGGAINDGSLEEGSIKIAQDCADRVAPGSKSRFFVKITDKQTGEEWHYGSPIDTEYSHVIYAPIRRGSSMDTGELYFQFKPAEGT